MIQPELTDRQRFIGAVVAARLHDDQQAYGTILDDMRLPPQLTALAREIGEHVPAFLPRFLVAVDPSADLTTAWPRFAVWLLRDVCLPAITVDCWKCREAVETVARLYEDDVPAWAAAWAAAGAAGAAARAAAGAAWDAARAAAWAAAWAAAGAAGAAARAAAGDAAFQRMADKLMEIVTDGR